MTPADSFAALFLILFAVAIAALAMNYKQGSNRLLAGLAVVGLFSGAGAAWMLGATL